MGFALGAQGPFHSSIEPSTTFKRLISTPQHFTSAAFDQTQHLTNTTFDQHNICQARATRALFDQHDQSRRAHHHGLKSSYRTHRGQKSLLFGKYRPVNVVKLKILDVKLFF